VFQSSLRLGGGGGGGGWEGDERRSKKSLRGLSAMVSVQRRIMMVFSGILHFSDLQICNKSVLGRKVWLF
jgi:hypothetical protein